MTFPYINVSVNSKPDHCDTRGFAHSSCPWGRVFAPLSCPGVFNRSRSSIILGENAIFALSLKQMGSSSIHVFMYVGREQCDLGPIYTMQRIRIYPCKLKFILVKTSPYPGHLHAEENQTLFTFLTAENFISGLPCSHEWKYMESIQICPAML